MTNKKDRLFVHTECVVYYETALSSPRSVIFRRIWNPRAAPSDFKPPCIGKERREREEYREEEETKAIGS